MDAACILGNSREVNVIPLLVSFYLYSSNRKVKEAVLNALLNINSLEPTLKEFKSQGQKLKTEHYVTNYIKYLPKRA